MATRRIALVLLFVLLGSFTYSTIKSNTNNCVTVYIDYGKLDNNAKSFSCIDAYGSTNALSVLRKANVLVQGTEKYGLKVVCRINNLPDATQESCKTMPPESAYWAVLIKRKQFIPNPFDVNSKWNWAQTGISEVKLNPGDSVGLVFANNGKVAFPK